MNHVYSKFYTKFITIKEKQNTLIDLKELESTTPLNWI